MKVIAYFQFYLPYLLPRHDDWKGQSIRFNTSEFEIVISPRGADEPVILENDKFILSMRIETKSVADQHSVKSASAEGECCDRLQVAVVGEVANEAATRDRLLLEKYMAVAIDAANIFIDHCRVLATQPGMTKLSRSIASADISGPQFPYSIWWQDAETRKWLHGTGSGGSVQALIQNPVSWTTINTEIGKSIEPELSKSLILDARQRFYAEDFREAVLAMAMACEVASNLYVERMGATADPETAKVLAAKNKSFADKRFHLAPQHLSSRSLRLEKLATFSRLERLYRVRNGIVHRGVLEEEGTITDRKSEIQVVSDFLSTAEESIHWLSSIQKGTRSTSPVQRE